MRSSIAVLLCDYSYFSIIHISINLFVAYIITVCVHISYLVSYAHSCICVISSPVSLSRGFRMQQTKGVHFLCIPCLDFTVCTTFQLSVIGREDLNILIQVSFVFSPKVFKFSRCEWYIFIFISFLIYFITMKWN